MTFTALHRVLGVAPGPLTDQLLDEAVARGVEEIDDLDWKSELPPVKGLSQTDFPKDVAAMANSGGGLIVYGVRESQKAATERVDAGKFDEGYERALRVAAINAITPPVFGLVVHRLGSVDKRAVAVEIPASVDGPHLIYRNEYFGAPLRNDSDTVWMKERQIEAMYRARFDERRHATEALDNLFVEAARGRNIGERAWLVAVGHPRVPRFQNRLTREEVRQVLRQAESVTSGYTSGGGVHPLASVDGLNPRPGLRRWVAANTATGDRSVWKEAWASIHHDGSVTIAAAVGGHPSGSGSYFDGWQVESSAIEAGVADLMALVQATAEATGNDEYDIRVGIEWAGQHPLTLLTTERYGYTYDGQSTPLYGYTPVETSVNTTESLADLFWHVHDLARDCVNQGGISEVRLIRPPARDEED
ncbi:helix-turn-helix domain-containing protein [Nocardia sp. NPDC057663]|uniref:AlbA family DNA-binding domain-containing protein n=1 Tax=Nocardia sp. NPDC057663 TaxID=3346201 RepID=UPI00366C5FBD